MHEFELVDVDEDEACDGAGVCAAAVVDDCLETAAACCRELASAADSSTSRSRRTRFTLVARIARFGLELHLQRSAHSNTASKYGIE